MNPLFHTDFSISDSLKNVRKSVLIYETIISLDALGRANKIQYPDGRAVFYTYGKGGERRSLTYPDGKTVFYGYDENLRLTELVHQDGEGILDRYVYGYDMLGNKTSITKERRGLLEESGLYGYGYDALGRLSQIQKDGQIQTQYGYDAFGNRTWKEEAGERTTYQHNALNQLLSETRDGRQTQYGYDRRGNLTSIVENGKCQKQYIYGALNRLEEAVNSVGKVARYQFNGLGHRVGKQEGLLPEEKIQKLDPQRRVEIEVGNFTQIQYTLDLTRQYHNLLERTEETHTQTYFWDGNVASYEENGETNYYLQDELGSPLRIADGEGTICESYGYGAFGEDLYGNQGNLQPFGYTGYQRDQIAGTYYAQAREYQAEVGRFAERDIIKGQTLYPLTINEYVYCGNMPFYYYDPNGMFWHIVCGAVVGAFANTVINVGTSLLSGEKITADLVLSSVVGGAVSGGITAATGSTTAGSVAGGAAESIVKGVMNGNSAKEIVQDVVVGAATAVAFSKFGDYVKDTSKVKELTGYIKKTKIGGKIFKSRQHYDSQITRARNAWKADRTIIKPRLKTYMNGFIGVTGREVIDDVLDLNASYVPGMDVKEEFKNVLNNIYDEGEEWDEKTKQMQMYTKQALDRLLTDVTNKELKTVLCIE